MPSGFREAAAVNVTDESAIATLVATCRRAQREWSQRSVKERLRWLPRFRHLLVDRLEAVLSAVTLPQRQRGETLASEVLPLADAARYLELQAARILRPEWANRRGRPLWCRGVEVITERVPWGTVLIIGPGNYPLLLPGVQLLQALVAGNGVLLKPGRDATAAAVALRDLVLSAGVPAELVTILPEAVTAVREAFTAGVDHVILTGSTTSGRAVLGLAAEALTPATVELSGCDACVVGPGAEIEVAARAIAFGLSFNGGATCMAPRRIFATREIAAELRRELVAAIAERPVKPIDPAVAENAERALQQALKAGGEVVAGLLPVEANWAPLVVSGVAAEAPLASADLFAPVSVLFEVDDLAEGLSIASRCPYALSVSVFGDAATTEFVVRQWPAGCVVVNDLIAPTADPRVSFAGSQQSGFGPTRGPEGLRQMTRMRTTVRQWSLWRPHLDPGPPPLTTLQGLLAWTHGANWRTRWQGLWRMIRQRAPED